MRQLAEDLWVVDGDNFIGGGAWFPVRMVVARIEGALWLHSPIAIDDPLAAELATLGPVRWIVLPNGFHSKWAGATCERYPEAELWSSTAHAVLKTKLPEWQPLDPSPPAAWAGTFDPLLIAGQPKVNETVFLHRASGTLIVTDLLFNIHESKTWLMPWILRMAGAWRRPMQSRLVRLFTKDRAAAGASCRRILGWDIQRVVMAHGQILEQDAKAQLESALHWMLAGHALEPSKAH